MKKCVATFPAIIVMGLAACSCEAGDIRQSVLANASDYSYMWWANELRDEAKTPHPRATDARSRGIKFPISDTPCRAAN